MMSIRSLADFNRSSLGGDGDWLIPPPSPPRPQTPGRHGEQGAGTFNWPPARTSTWPHAGTFSWPRTRLEVNPQPLRFPDTDQGRPGLPEMRGDDELLSGRAVAPGFGSGRSAKARSL